VCELSIYNSFPVIRTTIAKKSSSLLTPAFIFCLPWGRPCGNQAKRCINEKTTQCLPNPSQHIPTYLEQFPSYSNRKCKKLPFSRTAAHIFCFSWRRPCDYHAICCMDGKTIQCLSNPSQHVPIYFQQFPSYSSRKCKKSPFSRTAAHIFVSPGYAPGAITLNVIWMEREFDAYKLSRSMYLSIFTSFRVIRWLSQCVSPKIFSPHFLFSLGRPWGNHAKCCMDGQRIRCLQIEVGRVGNFAGYPVVTTRPDTGSCRIRVCNM